MENIIRIDNETAEEILPVEKRRWNKTQVENHLEELLTERANIDKEITKRQEILNIIKTN